jgi:uncharacterized membrane protein HdeD (DUF308 family)
MWLGAFRTLIFRGFFTALFGALLIGWPGTSLSVLILVFGAFTLIEGALIVIAGWETWQAGPARGVSLVAGVLTMLAGVAMLVWPGVTRLVLLVLIAIPTAVIGVSELLIATHIDRHARGSWLMASLGVLSVVVAALLLANPAAGILVIVRVFGLYTVVVGLLTVARAWVTEPRYA